MITAAAKVYGPYSIVDRISPTGIEFAAIPYAKVAASQIMITLADNAAAFGQGDGGIPDDETWNYWLGAEIEIVGSIQGCRSVLKRQLCRMTTGPMMYSFEGHQVFDLIAFRSRLNMGGNLESTGPVYPFTMTATIYVQSLQGIGAGERAGFSHV